MKKLTVLSFYADREATTSKLQDLGLVHLETAPYNESKDLDALVRKRDRIKKAAEYLKSQTKPSNEEVSDVELEEVLSEIEQLRLEKDAIRKKREVLHKELSKVNPWGEFDKDKLKLLSKKGLLIRFFIAKKRNHNRFDFQGYNHYVIDEVDDKIYFVIICGKDEELKLPFEEVKLIRRLPSEIREQLELLDSEESMLKETFQQKAKYQDLLIKETLALKNLIAFIQVKDSYNIDENGKILTITGWYPTKIEDQLVETLKKQGISFYTSEPSISDRVPIQLKNNRYSSIFELITRIFQLPSYHEFDLTPLIAVFYPIFFAYCLGDAGYGFVLMVIAITGGFTFLKDHKNIAIFATLLGLFTTIMGLVKSGSLFGIPLTDTSEVPFIQFLSRFIIIPDDRSFIFNAFNVSLMIGVVQILVGVLSSIFKYIVFQSFKHSLPQIGKFLVICGILILFLTDVQNMEVLQPYANLGKGLIISGIILVLLFHDLSMSLFKRIGSGMLPVFFIFTGILGDVLSYVRLFALGVVSSVLGLVVNQIGMQILGGGWLGIVFGIIFLLFGHSLNLSLAILGAIVHPLRLTFVEFYNNAQFEGGGIEYKPFKKV